MKMHTFRTAVTAAHALNQALLEAVLFTFANSRVIAIGISSGGGAVLRAADLTDDGIDADWLDAIAAGEPNVYVEDGSPIYDYSTEAATLIPCALLYLSSALLAQPPLWAQAKPLWV